MVTLQVRELPVVLDCAVNVKVPFPVPLLGETLSHVHSPETLQLQVVPVKMETVVFPPQAGIAAPFAGEIV